MYLSTTIFFAPFLSEMFRCALLLFFQLILIQQRKRVKEFLLFISSPDQQGSGKATAGVFTYFFWVLLQPFRANPEYRDVADLPYNSTCLENIKDQTTDMKSLSKYIMITAKRRQQNAEGTNQQQFSLSQSMFWYITKTNKKRQINCKQNGKKLSFGAKL